MSSVEFQYTPNQTVFAIDRNSFVITELLIVDGRYKAFTRNGKIEEQFKYTAKTPKLGIHSSFPPDVLYDSIEDAADALFNTASGWNGVLPTYSIDYLARPPETIYFVDKRTLAIYSGVVESVHIKTFMKDSTIIDSIEYQVMTVINGDEGYERVKERDIFLSYDDAYESLFGVLPTPTPTVSWATSPTPTTSATRSPTPTPSSTIGVSVTPMESMTPTPTPSSTMFITPTPSVTPSVTATNTPSPSSTPVHDVPDLLLTSRTNGSGTTLRKGMVVSLNKSGELVKASSRYGDIGADCSSATRYLGIVYDDSIPPNGVGRVLLEGSINNTDTNWANIILGGSPMHAGYKYYLSETPGLISATPPTSGYIKQVGFAATSRTLDLRFGPLIKLRSL